MKSCHDHLERKRDRVGPAVEHDRHRGRLVAKKKASCVVFNLGEDAGRSVTRGRSARIDQRELRGSDDEFWRQRRSQHSQREPRSAG